jgi:hypothetical protein
MENYILAIILGAIVFGIVFYLIRAKRNGQKCIGCPSSKECSLKGSIGCACGTRKAQAEKKDK